MWSSIRIENLITWDINKSNIINIRVQLIKL
jgi:hypothetical protein